MLEMFQKKSNTEQSTTTAQAASKGRKLQGTVVSDKMKKTVVVAITSLKLHPKYKKYFKVTKKFKAHDENNEYHVGDQVLIQETRPMSKEKRWIVVGKI
jgi:small subunit ribosomal protein S17